MGLDFTSHIRITWYHTCATPKLAWSISIQPTSSSAVAKRPLAASCHRIFC